MTYSIDFRRRVLSIRKKEGLTLEQTSQRFGVGRASLCRWLKRLEPDRCKPRKRKIDPAALARDMRQYPESQQFPTLETLVYHKKSIGATEIFEEEARAARPRKAARRVKNKTPDIIGTIP